MTEPEKKERILSVYDQRKINLNETFLFFQFSSLSINHKSFDRVWSKVLIFCATPFVLLDQHKIIVDKNQHLHNPRDLI